MIRFLHPSTRRTNAGLTRGAHTSRDALYASVAPYNSRPARDTRNAADGIYGNQTVLLLGLSGDTAAGFTGSISLGVRVGQIDAG